MRLYAQMVPFLTHLEHDGRFRSHLRLPCTQLLQFFCFEYKDLEPAASFMVGSLRLRKGRRRSKNAQSTEELRQLQSLSCRLPQKKS